MAVWQRVLALLTSVVLGLLVLPPGAHTAPAGEVDAERLDRFVVDQMERADVPGVAYAVVGPDGIEHQGTFGEDGDGRPVTADTPFLWGSVAKPVTATLVVMLAADGALDLDEQVTTYLPDFAMADDAARKITVRHLLSQTGGIPERMDLTDRYGQDRRPADLVRALSDVELVAEVGEEHVYSSLNYVILAAVVEAVTDHEFADVLRERLLEPAGMTSVVTDPQEAAARLPAGHRYVLGRPVAARTSFDPAGLAAGYLGGTLGDAVAFARANLGGSGVLPAQQREMLVDPEVVTGEGRSYGLGWRTWPVFGAEEPMVWHSGAAPGYQAGIVLLPEQDRAVVVLQNVYGSFQETQLLDTSWGLASLLSGAEPQLHEVERAYVVVLSALALVCLVLVGAVGGSVWRARRAGPRVTRLRALVGLAVWVVLLSALGMGLLMLPSFFGVTLAQVPLWAPDVAALLDAGLVLVVVLALCRVAVAAGVGRGSGH